MALALAVVVVNYGSSALLARTLADSAAAVPDAAVYVVDNRTDDAEAARVDALAAEHGWGPLLLTENTGFGGGANAGMRAAFADGADAVLLLNPDAWVDRACVDALAAASARDPLALLSPVVRSPSGRVWFDGADLYLADGETRGRRHRETFAGEERVEWLSGACLWVTRQVWERTGGFDERYFLYWEDVDLSRRIVAAGGSLAVVADATAWHDEGATHRGARQRSEAKSPLYYYFNIRNRLLFAADHLDHDGVRRWLRSAPASARAILLRGGRRQFLRPVGPLRAAARGLRDGRRIARAALSGPGTEDTP